MQNNQIKLLIKNTTKEEREKIVREILLRATNNGKDVPPAIVLDLMQQYIDGKTELLDAIKTLKLKKI